MKVNSLTTIIPERGIAYSLNGEEIGSIVIRPEHIAFIAGNWCKQITRGARRSEIVALSKEHNQIMQHLIKRKLLGWH